MSPSATEPLSPSPWPAVLVEPSTKQRPRNVDLMNDWQYVERCIHRLLAAWGRDLPEWENKSALHRHIWDQAECVRRLRERVEQFPGGKADAPVSARLEHLANAVLLAPSLQDALDGIYELQNATSSPLTTARITSNSFGASLRASAIPSVVHAGLLYFRP